MPLHAPGTQVRNMAFYSDITFIFGIFQSITKIENEEVVVESSGSHNLRTFYTLELLILSQFAIRLS